MNAFCCMFFLLSIKEEEHLHNTHQDNKTANTNKKTKKKQIINKREYNKWTCNNGHKFNLNW